MVDLSRLQNSMGSGPRGKKPTGQDGRDIELRATSSYIQWRYRGFKQWFDLVSLKELKGDQGVPGKQGFQGIQGEQGTQGIAGVTGPRGPQGFTGPAGPSGAAGVGVPTGGTTGQVLAKNSPADYDTEWVDQSGGGVTEDDVIAYAIAL